MFEIVYDGRTTDGRRLDGYTISSPCELNGSVELISVVRVTCQNQRTNGPVDAHLLGLVKQKPGKYMVKK